MPEAPDERYVPQVLRVDPPAADLDGGRAEAESSYLANDKDLDTAARHSDHERRERFRDHVGRALIFCFWIIVVLMIAAVVSWAWHFIMPAKWHYLDKDQLSTIQTVVISGALASIVPAIGKKYF